MSEQFLKLSKQTRFEILQGAEVLTGIKPKLLESDLMKLKQGVIAAIKKFLAAEL